jgi:hypothetical protein
MGDGWELAVNNFDLTRPVLGGPMMGLYVLVTFFIVAGPLWMIAGTGHGDAGRQRRRRVAQYLGALLLGLSLVGLNYWETLKPDQLRAELHLARYEHDILRRDVEATESAARAFRIDPAAAGAGQRDHERARRGGAR